LGPLFLLIKGLLGALSESLIASLKLFNFRVLVSTGSVLCPVGLLFLLVFAASRSGFASGSGSASGTAYSSASRSVPHLDPVPHPDPVLHQDPIRHPDPVLDVELDLVLLLVPHPNLVKHPVPQPVLHTHSGL
jgi:hypothetical protein